MNSKLAAAVKIKGSFLIVNNINNYKPQELRLSSEIRKGHSNSKVEKNVFDFHYS